MATGLDYLADSAAAPPKTGLDYLAESGPAPKAAAPSPAPSSAPAKVPGNWDVFGNAVVKGVAGLGDMVGSTLVNAANLGIAGYGYAKGLTGSKDLPDLIPPDALSGYKKLAEATGLTKPENEPQNGAQRVIDFTGQVMGGGGINPRSILRSAGEGTLLPLARDFATPTLGGVGGGLTAEAIRDNVDPDTWYGRLAAAVLPAATQFGASSITARPNIAGQRAAQTTKNVTPQQWADADALAKKAAALGAPISAPEALIAVTGNNPGLSTLQRVTEQSTHGVNKLAPAYAQRPEQNRALFGDVASGIYPNQFDPGALSGEMQTAAQAAIDNARQAGNAKAAPFYAATSNNPTLTIPSSDWNSLTANPAVAWALQRVKGDPLLGVTNAQPGSLQWLDAAKKFLDSSANSSKQAGDNFPAGQASSAAKAITDAIDPIFPDYAKARSIIAKNRADVVEPMQQGQVGKLAGTDDFVGQAGALLPSKPMDVTPPVVAKTAATLADPELLRKFIRQHLEGNFNESAQDLQGGPNQFGGAKFAAQVAGNDTQRANLTQLLSSSGANPRGLLDALQVWRAQGTRPQPGSMTSFNNGELGLLSGEGSAAAMVGKPFQLPGLLMNKLNYAFATKDLAEAIKPTGMTVEKFRELARANGAYSPSEQAAFAALLTSAASRSGPAPQQSP
jgi:hypothetical protein